MAKRKSQKRSQGRSGWGALPPGFKVFRPVSWHDGGPNAPTEYLSHLLHELGRLGLEASDIERDDRPPNTKTVLSDLMGWLDGDKDAALAHLVNWRHLDLECMSDRVNRDRRAKPRIEISATITKMNNLSVCWHPGGWRESSIDWSVSGERRNLIELRRWAEPPDFWFFVGDEEPTFQGRATNELMYVRGVNNLKPEPREEYGPYATYNRDVVDSILICAVRSAYERLIEQLKESFDVTVMDAFDFVTRDERRDADPGLSDWPIKRVISWSLADAAELHTRRQQASLAEKERNERHALETVLATYGCSIEAVVETLVQAYSFRSRGRPVSPEGANRDAAKSLRAAGAKIDAGDIRRIRELIECYRPELLPATLREQPAIVPEASRPPSNVVVLRPERGDQLRARAEHTITPRQPIVRPVQPTEAPTTKIEASADQGARLTQELDRVVAIFRCTPESVVRALVRAYSRQPPEKDRSDEDANREAAKELRLGGALVDTEGVRRFRRLLGLCKPEILPEVLRAKPVVPDSGK